MCPACLATAALILVGTTSTGGLAALAVKKFGAKRNVNRDPNLNRPQSESSSFPSTFSKEEHHDRNHA